jgi:serine/threonine protein kinase
VQNLLRYPRPDAAVIYHDVWDDIEGVVILMDEHDATLRKWINPQNFLGDGDWFPIMLGIATRLANAHAMGHIHKDLKPSNSSPKSRKHY